MMSLPSFFHEESYQKKVKLKFKKEKPKGINTSISQFRARRGNKLLVRSRVYIVTRMQVGCVILSYTIKSIPLIILRNIFKAILLLHSLTVHLFFTLSLPPKNQEMKISNMQSSNFFYF